MTPVISGTESLRRLFAALTEQTFQVDLGVADPPLTDYLVELLLRFVRMDAVFRVRDTAGRRLEEVAEMMMEAEERQDRPQRELYRHIGDITLFFSGVFPEALTRLQSPDRKDHLIDYCQQGKQSYLIASTFDDERYRDEVPVLRRLSQDFELCSYGLNRVRGEWQRLPAENADPQSWGVEQN